MPDRPGQRALIVGAGLMGRWHAYEVRRVGSTVVGVVDPDSARARELARRHRAPAFEDLPRALERTTATVVHVCTPTPSHAELVRQALDGGRHVLVEKPLAEDAATTDALLEHSARVGLLLAPVHQFRFQRGVQRLLRAVPDRLGALRHVGCTACSAGAEGRGEAEAARIAGDILPHFFSLVHALLPEGLEDVTWAAMAPGEGELRLLGCAGPVSASIVVSMAGRPPRTSLEVVGELGSGYADLFHGFSILERGGAGRAWKVARPIIVGGRTTLGGLGNLVGRALRREPAYPGLRELVGRFHRAAAGDGPVPVSTREARAVARAGEQVVGNLRAPQARGPS